MRNRDFGEFFEIAAKFISIPGMVIMIVSLMVNFLFYKETSQIWDYVGVIGAIAFILPFFIFQFILPSGLFGNDIPFWGKIMFYLGVFPFANIWMLSATDALFSFMPNFHLAMQEGSSLMVVRALREQWLSQGWMIIIITYVLMIGAGLLFRELFHNRLKIKTA